MNATLYRWLKKNRLALELKPDGAGFSCLIRDLKRDRIPAIWTANTASEAIRKVVAYWKRDRGET